jgi:hypothetical protein
MLSQEHSSCSSEDDSARKHLKVALDRSKLGHRLVCTCHFLDRGVRLIRTRCSFLSALTSQGLIMNTSKNSSAWQSANRRRQSCVFDLDIADLNDAATSLLHQSPAQHRKELRHQGTQTIQYADQAVQTLLDPVGALLQPSVTTELAQLEQQLAAALNKVYEYRFVAKELDIRYNLLERQIVLLGYHPKVYGGQIIPSDGLSSPHKRSIDLPYRRTFNNMEEVDNIIENGSDTEPDFEMPLMRVGSAIVRPVLDQSGLEVEADDDMLEGDDGELSSS